MTSLTPHQAKALNYKAHTSLTANAGSGKTFVLSKRYLEIALNEDVSLRNIAAITFTDKAAGELYKKIVKQVDEKISQVLESGAENENRKLIRKLEDIRRQLVSANISTIHSFCIDILREFPVETGIDANFIPIDEQLSSELIELSIDEVIRKSLISEKDSELKYLIRIFASKQKITSELFSLIQNRRNVSNLASKIYNRPIDEIAHNLFNLFLEYSKKIISERKDEVLSNLKIINDKILSEKKRNQTALSVQLLLNKIFTETEIINIISLLQKIKETVLKQDYEFRKKYLSDEIQEIYQNETDSVKDYFKEIKKIIEIPFNHNEIESELAHFGRAVIEYFDRVLKKYTEKKKEHSYLDFEDILLLTRKILENETVRNELTKKYKYIMIDEYQDTNEIQYEIFLPILEYLQKGNLFIVGDEKQSIYMFRDAELEIFLQTQNQIKGISGEENLRTLPDSFRMSPAICLLTNKLFENLFDSPNELYNEVRYSEIVCARNENVNSQIEFLIAGDEENQNDNCEAELTAKKILELINSENQEEKIRWKDIGILCRKRKSFAGLEKAFVKYKIPFVIVGGKGFYQKQIIYDFYNYFSFLLDKNNDTALIGILRSPFFSISDSDIFEISLMKEKSFWKKFKRYSVENKKFENVVNTIEKNLSFSKSSDITELLRKMLDESDMLSVLSSRPNGIQEIANVEKLIKLTIRFCSRDFITLYDYVNFLEESIEKVEDEAQAAVTDESDSVNIMTLHQSKGLEFPVVFLFNCNDKIINKTIRSKELFVDKSFGLLTKVPIKENYFSGYKSAPIISVSDFIRAKKDTAELKRLLYVGITRAKDRLIISAGREKDFNYGSNSFIGLIGEGLGINFNLPKFKISGNLKFLKNIDGNFHNADQKIEIEIPIIKNIEPSEISKLIPGRREAEIATKKLLLDEIKDFPKGEIISATKVAVFTQCPVKYELTYEVGLTPLFSKHKTHLNENKKNKKDYEFSEKENKLTNEKPDETHDNIRNFSDIKGRIIHKVLQKEVRADEIIANLENFISEEFNTSKTSDLSEFKKDILSDLNLFYASGIFKELRSYGNYKNEFEIYVKENDYYLYGIIDKIIFIPEANRILIVDYKTDGIEAEEIEERSKSYMTQLKFYSYIVSQLFSDFKEFELRLIFIKYPGKIISERINSRPDLEAFQAHIKKIVFDIRNQNFNKNLDHCKKCFFAVKNNCIKN